MAVFCITFGKSSIGNQAPESRANIIPIDELIPEAWLSVLTKLPRKAPRPAEASAKASNSKKVGKGRFSQGAYSINAPKIISKKTCTNEIKTCPRMVAEK